MNSNNKWKNTERSKKQKSETSADSDSPRGSVGQVRVYIHRHVFRLIEKPKKDKIFSLYCRNCSGDACLDRGGFCRLSVFNPAKNVKQVCVLQKI